MRELGYLLQAFCACGIIMPAANCHLAESIQPVKRRRLINPLLITAWVFSSHCLGQFVRDKQRFTRFPFHRS